MPKRDYQASDYRKEASMSVHPWRSNPSDDVAIRAEEDRVAAEKPPTILHRDLPSVLASVIERLAALERDHNDLCRKLMTAPIPHIHPYSLPFNKADLSKKHSDTASGAEMKEVER